MREFDHTEIAKVGIPPLAAIVVTVLCIAILGVVGVILATPVPS